MTKEEIKNAIENARVRDDNSTELLVFFNSTKAYCVHGMNCGNRTIMVVTRLIPSPINEIEELPNDIESMESMWYCDLMSKFGGLYEAMNSVK